MHVKIVTLCVAMLAATSAFSEIYRWTDENGKVHFSDKRSNQHSTEPVKLRINTYEGVSHEALTVATSRKVVMYSASWCGVCKKAARYFKEEGIGFAEYDVETSARGRADYRKLKAKGVPVILVGEKRMNGFSIGGFEKLYP